MRAQHKLNSLTIKSAIAARKAVGGGVTLLSDGAGLNLRIEASGRARWIYRYTRPDGRMTDMGLGSLEAVTLRTARELAEAERQRRALGADPVRARKESRAAARAELSTPTFGEVADAYVREKVPARSRNEKHQYQWAQTLGDTYCGAIRSIRVDRITTDDVLRVLTRQVTKKFRGVETAGTLWQVMPETASRLQDRIKRVLDYAAAEGYRSSDNPARWAGHLEHKLDRPTAVPRHQPSMPYREVPEFIAALRTREAVSALALEFLILSACRAGEVRGAQWDEIDLQGRVWNIPASRTKNGVEHRVPLTGRMVGILRHIAPRADLRHGLVFSSTRAGVPMSDMVFKMLMDRMKVTGVTAHGFRSSFRDWAGDEAGASSDVAEAALGHKYGSKVERAYRRSDAFERRRKLMEAWAAYCEGDRSWRAKLNGRAA